MVRDRCSQSHAQSQTLSGEAQAARVHAVHAQSGTESDQSQRGTAIGDFNCTYRRVASVAYCWHHCWLVWLDGDG